MVRILSMLVDGKVVEGNVLPAYQYQAFTVAMWVKGASGQADRRVFSESSTAGNNQLVVNASTENHNLAGRAAGWAGRRTTSSASGARSTIPSGGAGTS